MELPRPTTAIQFQPIIKQLRLIQFLRKKIDWVDLASIKSINLSRIQTGEIKPIINIDKKFKTLFGTQERMWKEK